MWHIYDIRHLLYCNTIHPLLTSLDSVIRLGYMDDVTLDGPQDVVATDVQSVLNLGHAIGLSLNIAKCEIIITHPYGVVTYRSNSFVFCAYPVIGCRTVGLHIFPDLLRMQLGQGDVKILPEQSTDWRRSADIRMRLYFLEFFSALQEYSICFAARRRSTISALQTFDDHLRLAVSNIINSGSWHPMDADLSTNQVWRFGD